MFMYLWMNSYRSEYATTTLFFVKHYIGYCFCVADGQSNESMVEY